MTEKRQRSVWGWIGSILLIGFVLLIGAGLAAWKRSSIEKSMAMSASQPEPMESIEIAVAQQREHRTTTTSVGTVMALRSVTLQNELAGTVREVNLAPGQIVEPGTVLVALDVSVEEAELKAQEAQAVLAESNLNRMLQAAQSHAMSELDVDRARAERDIAIAQIARIKAIIEHKTIRAPFRALVGLSDVHVGQYLREGTTLTTLQGIEDPPAVHVDFTVAQQVAFGLKEGDLVDVIVAGTARSSSSPPMKAKLVAIDAKVNQMTRNAMARARIDGVNGAALPRPGSSVRVRVPVGEPVKAVAVPVSALRKGPGGDHVFVIASDEQGKPRAHMRSVVSGEMLGDEILIYRGLNAGEQVAAGGSFKLRDGVLVGAVDSAQRAAGGQVH